MKKTGRPTAFTFKRATVAGNSTASNAGSIANVSIRTIVEWGTLVNKNDPSSGKHTRRKSELALMLLWCDVRRAGQFDEKLRDAFYAFCKDHVSRLTGQVIAPTTARNVVGELMRLMRLYAKEKDLTGVPSTVAGQEPRRNNPRVPDKTEFARLLLACLGYRWNPQSQTMVRRPKKGIRNRIRRTRFQMRRLLLAMAYSGSDYECAANIFWSPSPEGDRSYVDMRTKRLHRLGDNAPRADKMKGVSVQVSGRLMAHMRRWRRLDDANLERVIRVADYRYSSEEKMRDICADAGLPDLTLALVAKCFGAWGLRNGGTIRSLSISLGKAGASTNEKYKVYAKDYQKNALDAAKKKVSSIS